METKVVVDRIDEAAEVIDPVFLNSPQFDCEPLSGRLGVSVVLKVECVNPIRTFKGRGTDYLVHRLPADGTPLVCASAGNFGQGMAFACRKRGRKLTVFASASANALKVERMRSLGAVVIIAGADFDEAKDAAVRHARERGELYVEDGLLAPIAEGAGTIARELTARGGRLDAVFVPLGNGSLVNGMGAWLKRHSPSTRVIAVAAGLAPAMELSWRAGAPVIAASTTVADGIAVRVPVPAAVELMRETVDDVLLVGDDAMIAAMRLLFASSGLMVEPAAAAGLAAIAERKDELSGMRVATPLTGSNLTPQQVRDWIL